VRGRAPLVLIAAAAFLASWGMARPLPRPVRRAAPAWVTLLGPLRPLVADLLRLRFEAMRGADQVLGQLDDAWRVLALAPESVDDFVHFAWYFVFDAVRMAGSAAERDECVRAGFELLKAGRALHPRSARLLYAEALALDQFARHAPERIAALALPPEESPRGRALERFEEALALAAPTDEDSTFLRLALALCTEGILLDPATPARLRERARAVARRLLREGGLTQESRAALSSAVER